MKIAVFLAFILVLSVNLAYAGEKQYMDIISKDTRIVTLGESDAVVFYFSVREYNLEDIINDRNIRYEVVDKEQVVMLRESHQDKNFVELTVFIEGAEVPQYVDLVKGRVLNLDFDRDNVDDLFITAERIDKNSATLLFRKNNEFNSPDLSFYKRLYLKNNENEKQSYTDFLKNNLLYLAAVILLLIMVFNTRYVRIKYRKFKRRD